MKELTLLFLAFAKIGCTLFGGGYAMLPLLLRDIVDKYGWATKQELMDCFAVSQCTPGAIAVNTATFIGYKKKGIAGGVAATLGVVFPSFVIISLIAALVSNFSQIEYVSYALCGIRVCVCVLILDAVSKLVKSTLVDLPAFLIFCAALLMSLFTKTSASVVVVAAGVAGYAVKRIGKLRREKKHDTD